MNRLTLFKSHDYKVIFGGYYLHQARVYTNTVASKNPRVSFTEYFGISKNALKEGDFFNISLISDLPLFIDPFHLFFSEKTDYKKLHDEIIKYLVFLRQHSIEKNGQPLTTGELNSYYRFPEVKQNWLGYAVIGKGNGDRDNTFTIYVV